MLLRQRPCQRHAATLVEAALVYPTVLLLTVGAVIVVLGVSRSQQVAGLARAAARWASVHGGMYQQDTSTTLTKPADVYNKSIVPNAVGLDLTKLTYNVSWSDPGEMPTYIQSGNTLTNYVTVSITYTWLPEAFLGSVTLTNQSVMAMQY